MQTGSILRPDPGRILSRRPADPADLPLPEIRRRREAAAYRAAGAPKGDRRRLQREAVLWRALELAAEARGQRGQA